MKQIVEQPSNVLAVVRIVFINQIQIVIFDGFDELDAVSSRPMWIAEDESLSEAKPSNRCCTGEERGPVTGGKNEK